MACQLILMGTGHVFQLGGVVEKIIVGEMPDAVAVELDAARAHLLETPPLKKEKPSHFLYQILSKTQTFLARKFHILAGEDMRTALHVAHEHNIPLFYIDMNSEHVIRRLWNSLSLRKKISLICSLLPVLFIRKKDIENSIEYFEKNTESILSTLEKTFPEVKHILIDERDEFMAKKLLELARTMDKIVAVVGEGHIPGLVSLLGCENIHMNVFHLSHLLER